MSVSTASDSDRVGFNTREETRDGCHLRSQWVTLSHTSQKQLSHDCRRRRHLARAETRGRVVTESADGLAAKVGGAAPTARKCNSLGRRPR